MKSELSSIEVGVIVNEFKGLLGAKIAKISQLKDKDVVLQLHKPGVGRIKVRVMAPRAVFCTEQDFEFPEKPPGLCLQLRKHLDGARLAGVRQLKSERIIELEFAGSGHYRLVVELFSKGNIILCMEDCTIIAVAERQFWSTRKLVPGSAYIFPEKKCDFNNAKSKDIFDLLGSSVMDSVVKALAIELGLGGVYAEEVCLLARIDKSKKPNLFSEEEAGRIFAAIRKLLSSSLSPCIVYSGADAVNAVPFRLQVYEGMELKHFDSFSKAVDYYYSKEYKAPSAFDRKLAELQRIISEQEDMIISIKSDIDDCSAKGDAIYHNYGIVKDVIDSLNAARKSYSWNEIRERLKGHPVVKEVDEKQGKVVIEL